MRLLILTSDYPSMAQPYAMAFVHSRCVAYAKAGIDVRVACFSARTAYEYDGIAVHPRSSATQIVADIDLVASHTPNIRHHLHFLNTTRIDLPIALFGHGYEFLNIRKTYPAPYDYMRTAKTRVVDQIRPVYDRLKLLLLGQFIKRRKATLGLVFVSEQLKQEAIAGLGFDPATIGVPVDVIHNPVSPYFDAGAHNPTEADADFVTIRPLDSSNYAIDVVAAFAANNPGYTFHVHGQGRYFHERPAPANVTWHDRFVPQASIPSLLNRYRCALMPTRRDTQGVMMCEMAYFGMPVVTSDIPICRQMLAGNHRVAFIDNNGPYQLPPRLPDDLSRAEITADFFARFDSDALTRREIQFMRSIIERRRSAQPSGESSLT